MGGVLRFADESVGPGVYSLSKEHTASGNEYKVVKCNKLTLFPSCFQFAFSLSGKCLRNYGLNTKSYPSNYFIHNSYKDLLYDLEIVP